VGVHARAGAKEQIKHTDFDGFFPEWRLWWRQDAPNVPLSVLIGLYDGAKITICKGSRLGVDKDDDNWVTVEIPAGYACIFRGDCMHRGSAYAADNTRLHLYIVVENFGEAGMPGFGTVGRVPKGFDGQIELFFGPYLDDQGVAL